MNSKILIYLILTFLIFGLFTSHLYSKLKYQNKIVQTCMFVYDRIYLTTKELEEWMLGCKNKATPLMVSHKNNQEQLQIANEILQALTVSHLKLYTHTESSQLWEDWSKENGIVSKYVSAQLVVTEVLPGSEADLKGVRVGDVAMLFNEEEVFPEHLVSGKGSFKFRRGERVVQVTLEPKTIQYDYNMKLTPLGQGKGWLKVPSFKKQYFDEASIKKMAAQLNNFKEIIVDLRSNAGGNFVAGLRFLSLFNCQVAKVGTISRPKFKHLPELTLNDDLNDEAQIEALNSSSSLELSTFSKYPCVNNSINVKVIINSETASTAEMVAAALNELNGVKIYGAGSAGQLLVGIWYDLDSIWGEGIKITIPEAIYNSVKNRQIENVGVSVDQVIYDKLSDYQQGKDSWLIQVLSK